jgi:hypothetical protein
VSGGDLAAVNKMWYLQSQGEPALRVDFRRIELQRGMWFALDAAMTALLDPRRDQMLWQVICVQRSRKACAGASKDKKYDVDGDSSMGDVLGRWV